ncbi:autotransporter domain-containing protein, partial [Neisseriaceae bacterium TC5R-5]|nr:autotransporter domain-containing protein [Neisseriaceae bacterium TC5R-5]
NYHLGAYAGTQIQKVLFRSGLSYSWHNVDTTRHVNFPNYSDHLTADYQANTLQAFGEVALPYQWKNTALEPYLNLTHVNLRTGSYHESGQEAALVADSQNTNTSFSTVG